MRRDGNEDDEQSADQEEVPVGGDVDLEDLLEPAEEQRSDHGPRPVVHSADERHGDAVHRVGEAEDAVRLDVGEEPGERRAGHSHQGATQRRRDELEPQRRHSGAFGRHLVVADRSQATAQSGDLHEPRDGDGTCRHQRHDGEEQPAHAAEAEGRRLRDRDVGAARAAHVVPVDDEGEEHLGKRDRGDGEEDAPKPQRQVAHAETDEARHRRFGKDDERQRR